MKPAPKTNIYFKICDRGVTIIRNGHQIGRIVVSFGALPDEKLKRQGCKAIAYDINAEFRRQGIMQRALQLFIQNSRWTSLHAVIRADNIASQRLVLSCGFKLVKINDFTGSHVYQFKKTDQVSEVA